MTRETVSGLLAGMERKAGTLSEYVSKRVLAAYGVPVIDEFLVGSAEEAVVAAAGFKGPVVVKACGPALAHKSDRGLVALNVHGDQAVRAAVADLETKTRGEAIEGFLVQAMLASKREVIVGALRDRLFGPCVMLGLGGILVEVLGDVAFRLAPLDRRDALEMMNELRSRRMFDGFRGEPPVDRKALGTVLATAGQILLDHPAIAQLDINPLLFENGRPVAVDALVTLAPAGEETV